MNMRWIRGGAVMAVGLLMGGCAGLQPVKVEPPSTYALDAQFELRTAAPSSGPTLVLGRIRESAGFDSARMAYMRKPHELEYFARNKWVDTPGKMMAPLLVRALEASGAFGAVAQAPGAVSGNLRLETEIVRLQQEFLSSPSVVRLGLRAQLIDVAAKRIVATREFEVTEAAPADDPYGGVVAANRAVQRILGEVAGFCAAQVH